VQDSSYPPTEWHWVRVQQLCPLRLSCRQRQDSYQQKPCQQKGWASIGCPKRPALLLTAAVHMPAACYKLDMLCLVCKQKSACPFLKVLIPSPATADHVRKLSRVGEQPARLMDSFAATKVVLASCCSLCKVAWPPGLHCEQEHWLYQVLGVD
jgi:hypothetical protein